MRSRSYNAGKNKLFLVVNHTGKPINQAQAWAINSFHILFVVATWGLAINYATSFAPQTGAQRAKHAGHFANLGFQGHQEREITLDFLYLVAA